MTSNLEVAICDLKKKEINIPLQQHDMPTVLRIMGFRFFFYSEEGNEPPHIHVEKGDARGKYWTDPIEMAYMKGFTRQDIRRAEKIIGEYRGLINDTWHEYFS